MGRVRGPIDRHAAVGPHLGRIAAGTLSRTDFWTTAGAPHLNAHGSSTIEAEELQAGSGRALAGYGAALKAWSVRVASAGRPGR